MKANPASRWWDSLAVRIIVPVLVGFALGFVMSEGPALWVNDPTSRPAQTVELVIPDGTGERVAAGETAPAIPDGVKLATGDTLLVRNQDRVSHQLGPMWIPAGSTARLVFPRTVSARYSCSFTPVRTFGIQVEQRLTGYERFVFFLVAGLPFAGLLTVVSVFLWFSQKSPPRSGSGETASHSF